MCWKILFACLVTFSVLRAASVAEEGRATLRIAAAADLRFALEEVLVEFRKTTPEMPVEATYGSSGTLFAQIENGAPFDLFLSADAKLPRQLIEKGSAEKESFFLYALGHLAVWVPVASKLDLKALGLRALLEPGTRKVAVANPQVAPYGAAAVSALQKAGVYEGLKERLVLGENVAQAAQFAQSGAADAGLISLSLALSPKMQADGRFWTVPKEWAPGLEQAGVICRRSAHGAGAQKVVALLRSAAGQAILARNGFSSPSEAR